MIPDGFLRAILDAPDDDAPRAAFADWLQERGDPRGEFLAIQLEHARAWPDHHETDGCSCASCERFRRCRELATPERRREWAGPAHDPSVLVHFYRGFVETVQIQTADWMEHGPTIVQAQPIKHVLFVDYLPQKIQILRGAIVWVYHRAMPDGCHPPRPFFDEALHLSHESEAAARACMSNGALAWARSEWSAGPCPGG
jgi:uncharacterized protein (TIGR02996 family)